jgi:hypothetical protein
MSTEVTRLIAVPMLTHVVELLDDIDSASARAGKADPADRSDIARYETLSVELELLAVAAAHDGDERHVTLDAPMPDALPGVLRPGRPLPPGVDLGRFQRQVETWLSADYAVVCVCSPLEPGEPGADHPHAQPTTTPPPASRWQAPDGVKGRRAVEERFRSQVVAALSMDAEAPRRAISPSGIHNAVVTEILREYVDAADGAKRIDVAVEYRDGSSASSPFPLRALTMDDDLPAADLTLRLALLSIRHTEMDVVVDGAWLRNAEVSRPRPAAQTDDIVFAISQAQLAELTQHGARTLRLYLYQTGLETAVVGFYRAVANHMLEHPRTLSVVPMHHRPTAEPGKAKRKPKKDSVVLNRAPFVEGRAWIA